VQFIKNGPDIPERLLQKHEEGHIVFFCGAGISLPAGLPNFENLVKKICDGLNETPNRIEKTAIKKELYDFALFSLENRLVDGPILVRRQAIEILTTKTLSQAH